MHYSPFQNFTTIRELGSASHGLDLQSLFANNLNWIIAALVVAVGLLGFGLTEIRRFNFRRLWAISGVCFDESIRRRILWITPLAIIGVIVVSQLQHPVDEQDAIRQTTKFCLFTTGLVVVISTIILACTNLPREIENRVIFTVVTKPITRLEIVLGKIVGFARVSAAILAIMGVFTFGYLHLRAWSLEHSLADRLAGTDVDPITRPTLEHYRDAGLLNAKTFATPNEMQILARVPAKDSTDRYFNNEGNLLIPFTLPQNMVAVADPEGKKFPGIPGLVIKLRLGYDPATMPAPDKDKAKGVGFTGPSPLVSSTQASSAAASTHPSVQVMIYDNGQFMALSKEINGGLPVELTDPNGTDIQLPIAPQYAASLTKFPNVYVAVTPVTAGVMIRTDDKPAQLIVPLTTDEKPAVLDPVDPTDPTKPGHLVLTGRQGTGGQQIRGDTAGNGPVCIYRFENVPPLTTASGETGIPVEFRVAIEHGTEATSEDQPPTLVKLDVFNRKTGETTSASELKPETNRPVYASIPAAALDGGNFDLQLHCVSPQQWVAFSPQSLSLVQSETWFSFNLFKSLLVIWLLTVLVISISIFSSTFLSWPIAVVFTLVILLGRWGVQELGDAASAGIGRQFVQDFGVRNPATSEALSKTVEQLNTSLKYVSAVLPDITQFSPTEDIERGISLPFTRITDAAGVILGFAIPLSVLAFVFLKNKEVAP